MSAREIIAELAHLTVAELRAVELRINELTVHSSETEQGLRAERVAGRLMLAGSRVVRQAEIEAILDEFP